MSHIEIEFYRRYVCGVSISKTINDIPEETLNEEVDTIAKILMKVYDIKYSDHHKDNRYYSFYCRLYGQNEYPNEPWENNHNRGTITITGTTVGTISTLKLEIDATLFTRDIDNIYKHLYEMNNKKIDDNEGADLL